MEIHLGSKSKTPSALCIRITNSLLHIINPKACSESQISLIQKEIRCTFFVWQFLSLPWLDCISPLKEGTRDLQIPLCSVSTLWTGAPFSSQTLEPTFSCWAWWVPHCPQIQLCCSISRSSSSCWCSHPSKPLWMSSVDTHSQENTYHPLLCTKEVLCSLRNCKTHLI